MKTYLIKIYNDSDCLVLDKEIQAPNENDALIKILKNIIINDGDKITIEEL